MKKDYYSPHEIRTRNDEAVMELIECEGASGYGIAQRCKCCFCFFLYPGSVAFKRLWEELQMFIDKGNYRPKTMNLLWESESTAGGRATTTE